MEFLGYGEGFAEEKRWHEKALACRGTTLARRMSDGKERNFG
jgi:hypothetical protein